MGTCRECGKEASSEAKVCPHCGVNTPVKPKGLSPLTIGVMFIAGLFLLARLVSSIPTPDQPPPPATAQARTSVTAPASTPASSHPTPDLKIEFANEAAKKIATKPVDYSAPVSKWRYDDSPDKMSGKITRMASIESVETLHFGFPYKGDNQPVLRLLHNPTGGLSVMLQIGKGQFLCHSDCFVSVKFDNKKTMNFSASGPADHSTTMLFIGSEKKFLAELKTSKIVLIQATFYHEGSPVLTFPVAGLDWK